MENLVTEHLENKAMKRMTEGAVAVARSRSRSMLGKKIPRKTPESPLGNKYTFRRQEQKKRKSKKSVETSRRVSGWRQK